MSRLAMRIRLSIVGGIALVCAHAQAAGAAQVPRFVGSDACGACHAEQTASWSDSHHGWALKQPTSASVLGDFDDARFAHKGVRTRFFREEGRYFVETDGADGRPATFEIRYVVGVHPLQQYLVELDRGRLQALDIAWDVERKRWFHLYPDEDVSAGNGLHWTGPYKNWQARCAVCHQTDFRKHYDPASRSYRSTWSELTIGCEACHGPGEAHVAWSAKPSDFDHGGFDGVDELGLTRTDAPGRQATEIGMCGPCHARREALSADSTPPTAPFGQHYNLSPLLDGLYYADGQQRDEVYILGSFLQSRMHEKGVTCTNCHDPHSGGLVAEGNAVCTQCHNRTGRADFPTLKPRDFDSPSHHRHPDGSAGAQCVNCHMPERTYMVVDGRRDHFFRVPDPLLSEATGSPDACLACHRDKDAAWAAGAILAWNPERSAPGSAHAAAFAEAWSGRASARALEDLVAVASDTTRPAIVRATAVTELDGRVDGETVRALRPLLADGSELVRAAAVRLWRAAEPRERAEALLPLVSDPLASVRIAAALELSSLPPSELAEDRRLGLDRALGELRASLASRTDFPETQMAIGGLAMSMRNWPAASSAFSEAVFMDPQLVPAWIARARIAEALGDASEAVTILSTAREHNPGSDAIAGQLLDLHLRRGDVAAAIPLLREAAARQPANLDLRIRLAMLLLRDGQRAAARAEIETLLAAAPLRAEVLILHGLEQIASGDLEGARETARTLARTHPTLRLPPQLEGLNALP